MVSGERSGIAPSKPLNARVSSWSAAHATTPAMPPASEFSGRDSVARDGRATQRSAKGTDAAETLRPGRETPVTRPAPPHATPAKPQGSAAVASHVAKKGAAAGGTVRALLKETSTSTSAAAVTPVARAATKRRRWRAGAGGSGMAPGDLVPFGF